MLACKGAFVPHNLSRSQGLASFSSRLLRQPDNSLEMLSVMLVTPCASLLYTLSGRLPGESTLMAWRGGVCGVGHGGTVGPLLEPRKGRGTSPVKSVKGRGTCGGVRSKFSAALSVWDCSVLVPTDHVLMESEPTTWDSSGVAVMGLFTAPKESRLASG